jgi:hypothetical protein
MLTKDRVIRFRLSDDFAGRRLHTRSSRRQLSEARRVLQTGSRIRPVECNPLTDVAPSETGNQPSYACRLYAASAT